MSVPVPVAVTENLAVWPGATAALEGCEVTVGASANCWTAVEDPDEAADETPVKLMLLQPLRRRARRAANPNAWTGRETRLTSGKVAVFGRPGEIEQVFT